jgi:hypothetical protein
MLKKFWEGWKRFGVFLGDIFARVILTLLYFTLVLPFGLWVRFFGDPLGIKSTPTRLWMARQTGDKKLEEARRQS